MAISKRLRFEVLRRDNHTCRYCGRSAPDVKLTIDHVVPEALGGRDEAGNLVTACSDCNGGKTSIAPDSPLVADVAEDALRWGRAIAMAAEQMLTEHDARRAAYDEFLAHWNEWGHQPLPATWERSVDSFLAAGLPMPILLKCIDKAMANTKVCATEIFRYMCGIAWSRVTELQESARSMLNDDGAEVPEIVQLTEEQSGCTICMGAGDLPLTILDMLNPIERDNAIAEASATPEDDRVHYRHDPAEAACIAVQRVIDTRFQVDNAARLLLEHLPECVWKPVYKAADAEVRKAMGYDFTDYDLVVNRLRHLSMWINTQLAVEAVND